jgi:LysM repeat protein
MNLGRPGGIGTIPQTGTKSFIDGYQAERRGAAVRTALAALLLASLACQSLMPVGPDSSRGTPRPTTITRTPITTPVTTPVPGLSPQPADTAAPPDATASLPEATAAASETPLPPVEPSSTPPAGANYQAQSGDTLSALALRFNTDAGSLLQSNPNLPLTQTIEPELWLNLPLAGIPPDAFATRLLPDSQVVFSPSALTFDVKGFVLSQPGFLAAYTEVLTDTGPAVAGWELVSDYARRYSVNPRLLLALLELQSHALSEPNPDPFLRTHPLDVFGPSLAPGLSHQLGWAGGQLLYGFYGWQAGSVLNFSLADGGLRIADGRLNAGSFAVARLLGLLLKRDVFAQAAGPNGLQAVYRHLFGEAQATNDEPLIPGALAQPEFQLPFEPGKAWAFSGGPHAGYGPTLPWAALDFAPPADKSGCAASPEWDTAVHDGQVIYSDRGLVELDVGGGWTVVYLHVATLDRAPVGTVVKAGGRLGHPSCEGGTATSSHMHISRRYNGEWIPADGFAPFELSGWIAHASPQAYKGTLTKGDRVVVSCACAIGSSRLVLEP